MKINVISKKLSKFSESKSLNKQNKNKDYYTCEKLEHFFRECIQNKYKNKLSLYNNNDKFMTTIIIKITRKYKYLF